MGTKRIHKGKLFAFVGMAVIGGALYFGIQAGRAQQTVQTAPQSHIDCRAPKDYTNSNGYTESYTRSNICHSAKVFYSYADGFYRNSTNQRVVCPAGATVYTHNSGGGWHYSMSPNISGDYDGPAHHWCVDANGNQVEAVLADVTPPVVSAVTATNVTQTGAMITWTTDEPSDSQVGYGTSNLMTSWTPTSPDPAMVTSHSVNLTGLTAGTTYYYNAISQDAAGNRTYSANTFTTLATPTYSFNWTLITSAGAGGSIETKTGNKAITVMKLQNTGNTDQVYTVTCTPATGTFTEPSAWNGSMLIAMGTEKQFTHSIDVASMSPGTLTVTCKANRSGAAAGDEKTVSDTATLIAPVVTPTTGPTLNGTIFKNGQYIDPATNAGRTCVSPNFWMKEGATSTGARGFHCMPGGSGTTPSATDNPPTPCTGTLWASTTNSFSADYCSTTATVTPPPTTCAAPMVQCPATSTSAAYCATTCSTTPTPPPTTPVSCGTGEKCSSGSWCNNGQKCFYPDSQITCAAWPPPGSGSGSASCPSGTSVCDPADTNCVAPGQTVPYVSGKWCSQSQSYYSSDGANMACVAWGGSTPAGFSVCRPDDRSCIPENSYGPSSGNCYNSMKCYQKASDTNANNDVYCTKSPSSTTGSMYPEPPSCPSGYGSCSPTDTNCKEKGESWTDASSSYYCTGGSQKCTSASGGGSCVGWSEQCPAGTKYCDTQSESCVEPGEYKTLKPSGSGSPMGNNYWCGGSSGMVFYSSTQAYCEKKAGSTSGATGMMWTGEQIKTVLNKLGSGWGLCSPNNTNCIEPGKTGPSSGWCTWYPPGNAGSPMSSTADIMRTCPSLDGTTPPPPAPEKNWIQHKWTFTDGISESFILNRTDKEYLTFIASVDMQCAKISKNKFSWKSGAEDDSAGNWKNFGIPDCSGTGVPPPPPQPPGPEPRECRPGEVSSPTNMCFMPMYRWSYAEKKFEKCEILVPPFISASTSPQTSMYKPGYTSCQSMNYDLESGWRTKRYLVHPPEKDGDWYMPRWDSTYDRLQYSPEKDALEECSAKDKFYMRTDLLPDTWIGPCQPIPPEDKEWMLDMYRAQYKMFKMYREQWRKPGPGPEPFPVPIPEPIPVPPPDTTQCKPYLNGVRQGLVGDKQFWKDVNRKFNEVKGSYADAQKVNELLAQAKALIVVIDKAARKGSCGKETLANIQDNLDKLHTEIFSELSGYLTDMEDIGQMARCRTRLEQLGQEAAMFAKKAENDEDQEALKDLVAQITDKSEEFGAPGDEDFEFDIAFDCETFVGEVEGQLMKFRRNLNEDTRRISDQVIEKLGTHLAILTEDLSQKQKQIDALIVQVAELKKTAEDLTQAAKDVSDRLVTSYTALAQFKETFEEDRRQILAEKDRLVTLVEQAMSVMKDTGCVRVAADRDRMANELGQVATVNWTPSRGEQLEKRLQLIIDSCRAKDFTREDMNGFFANLDEAERANLIESHRRGYTPFADVPTHEWYYGGMLGAYENGYMTKGIPGESALAQDALLMVLRAAGATDTDVTGECTLSSPQVKTVSPYAVCAVNYANSKGLPLQSNMTLPVERIRIAEWITLLKPNLPKRADEAVDFDSFKDIVSLGNATRFVAYMYSNGIMVGTVDADGKTRRFEPRTSLTRAALAVILDQLRKVSGEPETH